MDFPPDHPAATAMLIGVVAPRPIAWVSTLSPAGVANLAPFSYFNLMGDRPPVVAFAPQLKPDGSKKDTLVNLEALGEFVVNLASFDLAAAVNRSSQSLPADESEFTLIGLAPAPSARVRPPRVGAAKAHLECIVRQLLPIGATTIVIGEVVHIHIADDALTNGLPDPAKLDAVGRLGGRAWCRTTERFELPRP